MSKETSIHYRNIIHTYMNHFTFTTLIAFFALLMSGVAGQEARAETFGERLRVRLNMNAESNAGASADASSESSAVVEVETAATADVNVSADTDTNVAAASETSVSVTAPQDDRGERRTFLQRLKTKLENDDEKTSAEARVRIENESSGDATPPQDDRMERRGYLEAKLRHEAAVEKYRDAREAFLELRARFRVSQSLENKAALEDRAEAFLRQTVDTMIQRLERIKQWATNHPRVSDEVEASVSAKIDAEIAALKNSVAALSADATIEDIQSVTAAVRNRFAFYKNTIAEVVADIRVSRIRAAIDKATALSARVETALSEASDDGVDTETAAAVFAGAKANLVLAKEKYASADFKASQDLVLEAFKDMKEVMVHLKAGAKLNVN